MSALSARLALVSQTSKVTISELTVVAAALDKQLSRDLAQHWDVMASCHAFPTAEDVPLGYWPIFIRNDVDPDAAGVHDDDDGQPFALVNSVRNWTLIASHEALEMVVDPSGNRFIVGDSPETPPRRVEFLVEVCDPCETFGYSVNGVTVSDFYTPHYFSPNSGSGGPYSFQGNIKQPRQVLPGGYLSWHDPARGEWKQLLNVGGTETIVTLPGIQRAMESFRSQVDRKSNAATAGSLRAAGRQLEKVVLPVARHQDACDRKAAMWHEKIKEFSRSSSARRGAKTRKPAARGGRKKSRPET